MRLSADARRLAVMGVLFVAALGIRLYRIDESALTFHETRQYRSLIIARDYYFANSSAVPAWQKEVARTSRQKQGILEPPVLEFLVSLGYSVAGGERPWLPHVMSTLFWLIGGLFLYRIGTIISDDEAAIFGTAFYLLSPFAIVASRSFQPDPLMVMLVLGSVMAMVYYDDAPSSSRLAVAAVTSALAFLVKPAAGFATVGAFLALAISRRGIRWATTSRPAFLFLAITILPTVAVYLAGIVTGRFLFGEATKTVLPQLWVSKFFWRGWLDNIGVAVGFFPLAAGLLGLAMLRRGGPRALMLGLWLGHSAFCLTLNYNVATHDYYQLQLIPIVGLSIGPVIALVMAKITEVNPQLPWRLAGWSVVLGALILSVASTKPRLVTANADGRIRVKQEIGERVSHSTNTIFLSSDYGVPLEYHGFLSGSAWPLAADLEWERLAGVPTLPADQRFRAWFSRSSPDYFIVEDLEELERQPDLKAFLATFPEVVTTERYLIVRLRPVKTAANRG